MSTQKLRIRRRHCSSIVQLECAVVSASESIVLTFPFSNFISMIASSCGNLVYDHLIDMLPGTWNSSGNTAIY